jgi:hypothetical protein
LIGKNRVISLNWAAPGLLKFFFMKSYFFLLVMPVLGLAFGADAQPVSDMVVSPSIGAPQLYPAGNQLAYPIIRLNSTDQLELIFDDLDADVKAYYYTYQLCDEDWTPSTLSEMEYLKGFSQVRIEDYRNSSVALVRYTHYHAVLPDQNCVPTHSGNYLLKVFTDGDTSKLAFARRFLVVDSRINIQSQFLQPVDYNLAQTHQHITLKLNVQAINPQNPLDQIKVDILQNYRWDNVIRNIKPNFYVGNSLEFTNDNDILFEGGSEWRGVDLQSFRFQSDRVQTANYGKTGTDVILKPDGDRSALAYAAYADLNGAFYIQTTESINVNYQGDYASVLFSFAPKDKAEFPDKDVYLLSRFTGGVLTDSSKMVFNPGNGRYERRFLLKMGYYSFCYVTVDRNDPDRKPSFSLTEGNHVETSNDYMILIYYHSPLGRGDDLVGISRFNSKTGK